jgi:hypothetical protein
MDAMVISEKGIKGVNPPIKKPRCVSHNGVLRSLKTLTGKCQR